MANGLPNACSTCSTCIKTTHAGIVTGTALEAALTRGVFATIPNGFDIFQQLQSPRIESDASEVHAWEFHRRRW